MDTCLQVSKEASPQSPGEWQTNARNWHIFEMIVWPLLPVVHGRTYDTDTVASVGCRYLVYLSYYPSATKHVIGSLKTCS